MQGERIPHAAVVPTYGISGDRGWAVRDEESGEIRGASKIHGLMRLAARYLEEPRGDTVLPVEITFADGRTVRSDDPRIHELLSEELDRAVTLWPRQPAENRDHYRRRSVTHEAQYRAQLGLVEGEQIPDYRAVAPPDMFALLQEYVSPPGVYFDAFELHVITTGSVASLAERTMGVDAAVIAPRRFRPNIVIDTGAHRDPFPEARWRGRRLRVGSVIGDVVMGTPRCSVITMPHAGLPRERRLLRTLVRETGMDFGVYLSDIEPGTIREGDPVELVD
jgi:uncharacterized protein YcbX